MIELNYAGQEKTFVSIEEAQEFALTLNRTGSDIWVNGELHSTRIYDASTGCYNTEVM